jgi:site-specific DNA-methyltransferase (adenine-specific)/adenine-specific DNA-methyltransferase
LRCDNALSCGDPDAGNLLVEGDNLLALKALLPYYAGQVKCIYIDPPYNTGEQGWIYSDNVNSPLMRKWLGKAVGKEAEDLSRDDKWLCMMYPRLTLLRDFLRADGVIFVSIDETEEPYLRLLLDEVFGRQNALGTLVWKRRSSSAMRGTPLSIDHEYVLCYASDASQSLLYGLEKGIESYPHEDERGHYASTDLTVGMTKDARPGQFYPITNPRTGGVYQPNPERVWRFFPETMKEVIDKGLIIWPDDVGTRMERPRYKTYYDPNTTKPRPVSSWIETPTSLRQAEEKGDEYDVSILSSGMNQEGGKILQQILGTKAFAYPKPVSLIASLVQAATRTEDIVLDSFAGSATTGHSVLELNRQDGGRRRFILVEMEPKIARDITAERLKRVTTGYTNAKGESVPGLGGGFRYCKLDKPLFDEQGRIGSEVRFPDLAAHVFFTETGSPIPKQASTRNPFLGVTKGTAYYLLFNGVLGDKTPDGGNVLTNKVLAGLRAHDGPKVIFGEGCLLGDARLKREQITFKQLPYEIKVS